MEEEDWKSKTKENMINGMKNAPDESTTYYTPPRGL